MSIREKALLMLEKSRDTLIAGRLSAANGNLDSAINRYYYSCFQKVATLMLLKNLPSSKHTHVRAFVNKELAYEGVLNKDLAKMYNKLMDLRQEADYSFDGLMTEEDLHLVERKIDAFHEVLYKLIKSELNKLDGSKAFL